jgi:hypothetical protein
MSFRRGGSRLIRPERRPDSGTSPFATLGESSRGRGAPGRDVPAFRPAVAVLDEQSPFDKGFTAAADLRFVDVEFVDDVRAGDVRCLMHKHQHPGCPRLRIEGVGEIVLPGPVQRRASDLGERDDRRFQPCGRGAGLQAHNSCAEDLERGVQVGHVGEQGRVHEPATDRRRPAVHRRLVPQDLSVAGFLSQPPRPDLETTLKTFRRSMTGIRRAPRVRAGPGRFRCGSHPPNPNRQGSVKYGPC